MILSIKTLMYTSSYRHESNGKARTIVKVTHSFGQLLASIIMIQIVSVSSDGWVTTTIVKYLKIDIRTLWATQFTFHFMFIL